MLSCRDACQSVPVFVKARAAFVAAFARARADRMWENHQRAMRKECPRFHKRGYTARSRVRESAGCSARGYFAGGVGGTDGGRVAHAIPGGKRRRC